MQIGQYKTNTKRQEHCISTSSRTTCFLILAYKCLPRIADHNNTNKGSGLFRHSLGFRGWRSLIVSITYRNKQLRKSVNFFISNMAVSDLFNPLTIMPIQIVHIISGSDSWKVDSPWMLGNILCKLCYFLPDASLVVPSLLLISMDRLVAAIFPLCTKLESLKARLINILCTWKVAIAVHAPYFYTFRLKINPFDNKTYCKSS